MSTNEVERFIKQAPKAPDDIPDGVEVTLCSIILIAALASLGAVGHEMRWWSGLLPFMND